MSCDASSFMGSCSEKFLGGMQCLFNLQWGLSRAAWHTECRAIRPRYSSGSVLKMIFLLYASIPLGSVRDTKTRCSLQMQYPQNQSLWSCHTVNKFYVCTWQLPLSHMVIDPLMSCEILYEHNSRCTTKETNQPTSAFPKQSCAKLVEHCVYVNV